VRLLLDHDVPTEAARVLRQEGHHAVELREAMPVQANDAEVLGYASETGCF